MHLDPKALEAAYSRVGRMSTNTHISNISALSEAIRAYLSASIPAEIGRLPQRLESLREHLTHQPLTHADDVDLATIAEAASALRALSVMNGEMERALEPFSIFAGPIFERNYNRSDVVDRVSAADGGVVSITAGHFFDARGVLAKGGNGNG